MKKSVLLTALVAITLSVMAVGCKQAQQPEAAAPVAAPEPAAMPAPEAVPAPAPEGAVPGQPGQ